MKNNKGITLIALVVTIIVLLILAGVSIAMLTGENGILTNATKSAYETQKGEAMDKINLALNSVKTTVLAELVSDSTYNAVTSSGDLLDDVVAELGADASKSDATKPYYVSVTSGVLTIKYSTAAYTSSSDGKHVEGSITLTDNDLGIVKATEKAN